MKRSLVFLLLLSLLFIITIPAQPYSFNIIGNKNKQSKGYYFFCTYKMRKDDVKRTNQQLIIDENGHAVYYQSNNATSDFKVHKNSTISYFTGNKFVILDNTFNSVDSVGCVNTVKTDSHDFLILPNGYYALIGQKSIDYDFSRHNIFMQQNLPGSKKGKLIYNVIQLLNKNKELIYEWSSEKYFNINNLDKIYLNDTVNVDVTHFNSIDIDSKGNILVSARYYNELFKINRIDGAIIWRLGGKNNQFKFLNDTIPFLGQHDARFLPNGNISLFDNGYGLAKHNARVLEYKLDEINKTCQLVWSYSSKNKTIISEATGNAQRLKNGNTLINFGKIQNGHPNIIFEEVNKKGKVIFSLSHSDTMGSYRAFHYKELPKNIKLPEIVKNKQNGQLLLTLKNKYQSYLWSNGATSNEITVDKPGVYFVYVSTGNGGFLSSRKITIKERDLE